MTNSPDDIESQTVEARRRIAAAQVAIAKTLGMVKRQVRETVAGARLAANDIGANVKDTMSAMPPSGEASMFPIKRAGTHGKLSAVPSCLDM